VTECLLCIIATPAIEETVVDWLLARHEITGFSSQPISGHSVEHQYLSLAEQVTGRERKVMFHVQAPLTVAQAVLEDLKRDLGGAGLHYWILPVLQAGHL
jgi:hypothetical protein